MTTAQVGLTDDEARRMIEASKVAIADAEARSSHLRAKVRVNDVWAAQRATCHVFCLAETILERAERMDKRELIYWLKCITSDATEAGKIVANLLNTMVNIPVCANCGSEGPLSSGLCQSCWQGQRR